MLFSSFTLVAAVPQETRDRFSPLVPPAIAHMWAEQGAGVIGDGFFRLVNPEHARTMLGGAMPFPDDAVVLFTTALADVVGWWHDMFLLAKPRLGTMQILSAPVEAVAESMSDPVLREQVWQHEPYPAVAARLGVPGFDECFMHVPLLGLGGRGDPATMQLGNLWMHLNIMTQLTGKPRVTEQIYLPGYLPPTQ